MKHYKQLIIIILVLLSCTSYAQESLNRAKEYYLSGRDAFEESNYTEAIIEFEKAIATLGKTNIRIQSMLVRALYHNKAFNEIEAQLNIYFNLNPDKRLADYRIMQELSIKIEQELLAEKNLYISALEEDNIPRYKDYISKYPLGRFTGETRDSLLCKNDDAAWKAAIYKDKSLEYRKYIDNFTDGRHTVKAESMYSLALNRERKSAYEDAIKLDLISGYNNFLVNYPDGEFVNEIKERRHILKDNQSFEAAKENGTISSYKSYLSSYSEPIHKEEALAEIKKIKRGKVISAIFGANEPNSNKIFLGVSYEESDTKYRSIYFGMINYVGLYARVTFISDHAHFEDFSLAEAGLTISPRKGGGFYFGVFGELCGESVNIKSDFVESQINDGIEVIHVDEMLYSYSKIDIYLPDNYYAYGPVLGYRKLFGSFVFGIEMKYGFETSKFNDYIVDEGIFDFSYIPKFKIEREVIHLVFTLGYAFRKN